LIYYFNSKGDYPVRDINLSQKKIPFKASRRILRIREMSPRGPVYQADLTNNSLNLEAFFSLIA
jgi:hypothetical protein